LDCRDIDQDVSAREPLLDCAVAVLHCLFRGEIRLQPQPFPAGLSHKALCLIAVETIDAGHLGAPFGETHRNCLPNATGRARNDNDLTDMHIRHYSLLFPSSADTLAAPINS
jgi:hypothetical protein